MASKKAAKETPPAARLKKSAEDIASYIVNAGNDFSGTAKKFGVTPKDLKDYLFGDREKQVKNYWKNAKTRKILAQSIPPVQRVRVKEAKEVTSKRTGKKFINYYYPYRNRRIGQPTIFGVKVPLLREVEKYVIDPVTKEMGQDIVFTGDSDEGQRLARSYYHSIATQYETPRLSMQIQWQIYTSSKGLPTSIEEIKEMYADDEIGKRQAMSILKTWRDTYYKMSDDWYEDMVSQFEEYDEYRD